VRFAILGVEIAAGTTTTTRQRRDMARAAIASLWSNLCNDSSDRHYQLKTHASGTTPTAYWKARDIANYSFIFRMGTSHSSSDDGRGLLLARGCISLLALDAATKRPVRSLPDWVHEQLESSAATNQW
jgi:hypothetical protein